MGRGRPPLELESWGRTQRLLRNGKPARQLDIWWAAGVTSMRQFYAWEVPMLDDELLGKPDQPGDEWTVRVTGMRELALRVDGVSRYWSGEIEMPVAVRSQRGTAPSRGWIPEELAP